MAPLRIGVNALYLIPGGVGGTEIYLRSLLAALAGIDAVNQYVVFTNRETGADLVPAQPNFLEAPQSVRAANRPARLVWEQTVLPRAAHHARLDVLFNPGFTAPAFCSCPSVTVFHDLQYKRHPEFFRWFDLPFWRVFLYAAAHRSRLLIADSEATRADLLRYYRLPEAKIRVVPLGVDPVFFEIERGDLRNYLLYVSTLHPHKNQERLIRAFARFHGKHPEFRLVLAGMRGFHSDAVDRQIAAVGLADAVQVTGWIPREELHKLYRHAFACLYPSEFEGFGIPVLEALAAGIPTACSAIEPLASLALDAALQFDPADEDAIFAAMERLTGDRELRQRLAREGPRRASEFTWRRCAEATLGAIREAAGARSR